MSGKSANSRPWWKLNKREVAVASVFLSAILVGSWLASRIVVSVSPSLSHRIFLKVGLTPEQIQKGDYLAFKITEEEARYVQKGLNDKNDIGLKRVGCAPGQNLISSEQGKHTCDGQLLGFSIDKDSKGNQLPKFKFNGTVPVDSYFMVGTNPRSFDSKYMGFFHGRDFLFKALPLW